MITKNINGNSISQGFIDEIRSDSPRTMARLVLGGSVLSCDIVNINVTKGSCGNTTFAVGCVVGDTLKATVKNLRADIKGQELDYQIGALVNGSYEYISLGRFTVSEVKKTRYQQEITAYSSIVAKTGVRLGEISSPTLAQLGAYISNRIGCSVIFDSGIDNSQYITASLQKLTVYEAIQILAVTAGGFCANDNAGNIRVKKFDTTPNLVVGTDMMTKLPEVAELYTVGSVSCAVSEATYNTQGDPVEEVYASRIISGLNTEYDERIVSHDGGRFIARYPTPNADIQLSCKWVTERIFYANIEKIIGYSYYPADVHLTLGDPRLEGCDVLKVVDTTGMLAAGLKAHSGDRLINHDEEGIGARYTSQDVSYIIPCHQITHSYSGGFTSDIKSVSANDKANYIGSSAPISTRLDRIERETDAAYQASNDALRIAGNNNQYFWVKEYGEDTGAHVTEIPQEDFLDNPEDGGGNLLVRSNGVAIRDGLDELAIFSAQQLRIGEEHKNRALVNDGSFQLYDGDDTLYFEVSDTGIFYGAHKRVANTDDVDDAINTAEEYADGAASTAEGNAKTYANGVATTAENNAKSYADGVANTAENNAKTYAYNVSLEAEKVAKNYLYYDPDSGLSIAESNPSTATKKVQIESAGIRIQQSSANYVDITSDGLGVYKGSEPVAQFGEYAIIGSENDANIIISATETLFHGNAGALVGAIDSGSVIDGSFTEILPRNKNRTLIFQDTSVPHLIYSGALAYQPLSNISIVIYFVTSYDEIEYTYGQHTRTINCTQDSDVTSDGFRIKYTAGTRYLQVWYVSGHKFLLPVTYEVDGIRDYEDIDGSWRDAASQSSSKKQVVLTWTPYYNSSAFVKDIEVAVGFINPYYHSGEEKTWVSFTPSTASTKTDTIEWWYWNGQEDVMVTDTVTVNYDGNKTIKITSASRSTTQIFDVDYNTQVTSVGKYVGSLRERTWGLGTATYDRHFLAPQYNFGVSNDSGNYALATLFGEGLTAGASNQTLFGKYNVVNTKAFCIGTGTSDGARKNAFEVDWNGTISSSSQTFHSSDRRFKEHIDYLDDDAVEFIRELKPAHYKRDGVDGVGFYAQDVEDGFKTLGYTEIIAPLVRYCQKLEERIEELERRE